MVWIPVTENMPEQDVPVWTWDGDSIRCMCWSLVGMEDGVGLAWVRAFDPYCNNNEWRASDTEWDDDYLPVVWQPLPSPPQESISNDNEMELQPLSDSGGIAQLAQLVGIAPDRCKSIGLYIKAKENEVTLLTVHATFDANDQDLEKLKVFVKQYELHHCDTTKG